MESNVLTSIPGIEYYPIISLIMFFVLFAGLLLWFFLADRKRLDTYAREPFDFEDASPVMHHVTSTDLSDTPHARRSEQTYA
jgi:hypothetical protein